ncbi:MAG: hypothetical protein QOF83_3441 [Solirubrobacteraceae bacterium]|jgi:hypothetical protein|nr:hypothetical protein [Solirubrobacteraceae bacterium]
MNRVIKHLQSNVIAYLALFIALGGTSYAAFRLPAGSVGNRALKNHSVTAVKLDRGSIAGYVRDWARINANGKITGSRPGAHLVGWAETGPAPGGLIQWSKPVPATCFALATTEILPNGSPSYASTQVASGGNRHPGQTYVLMSAPQRVVNVAVFCPQP